MSKFYFSQDFLKLFFWQWVTDEPVLLRGIWLDEQWKENLESQVLPWVSLSHGQFTEPCLHPAGLGYIRSPKWVHWCLGKPGMNQAALLSLASLVHISCKSSLEQRILPSKKMENHRTSWSRRSFPGLAFSYDSHFIDHATVTQSQDSPNLSL